MSTVCVPTNVSNATTAPKVPVIVRARVSTRTCGPFIVVPDADHARELHGNDRQLGRIDASYVQAGYPSGRNCDKSVP